MTPTRGVVGGSACPPPGVRGQLFATHHHRAPSYGGPIADRGVWERHDRRPERRSRGQRGGPDAHQAVVEEMCLDDLADRHTAWLCWRQEPASPPPAAPRLEPRAQVGYLPSGGGAVFQELIDLAIVINAPRALRG